jgi:hypothetical protein
MANASQSGMQYLFEESVSAVTATPSVDLGTRRFEGGADWLYVYNGSTNEAIDQYRGCKLASLSSGYTVDCATADPSTITAAILAGVAVNATISTGSYGWIMTRGQASIYNKGSAAVGGDHIFLAVSGTFRGYTATTGTGALLRAPIAGQWLADASDTSSTEAVKAYIKSPLF